MFDKIEMYAPIWIRTIDEASVDNDIIVSIDPSQTFNSWNVVVTDDNGKSFTYGPFETNNERINPIDMLKGNEEGDFTANITMNTASGDVVESGEFFLKKIVDSESIGNRFSVIFNYAQSDAVIANEQTIRNDMAGRIAEGNKVMIHGHTDLIGSTSGNKTLSLKRANEVKDIFDDEFKKSSKNIYTEAIGYGEAMTPATFNNDLPEGRFYNRNVIVDVIPLAK
jgi:outer membrane protein OmpA-like peptidoglycan-associated protein